MKFSIVILTYQEADNLAACLESVDWCDDVAVLDSGSTDGTVEIARQHGVRVVEHAFENFGAQRNLATEAMKFEHRWLFHLDADERFTPALRAECEQAVKADEYSGYFVANRMFFLNRWIRRSSLYPYPQVRLVKRGEFRFEAAGHGQREAWAERGLATLQEPYDHYNFSKGIADWVQRHNRYSSLEAAAICEAETGAGELGGEAEAEEKVPVPLDAAPVYVRRLRKLKHGMKASPLRAVGKFLYLYVIRFGFLDGMPGLYYCGLQGVYEFMIATKVAERMADKSVSGQ